MTDGGSAEKLKAGLFTVEVREGIFRPSPSHTGLALQDVQTVIRNAFQDPSTQQRVSKHLDASTYVDPDITQVIQGHRTIIATIKNYGWNHVVVRCVRQADGSTIIMQVPRTTQASRLLEHDYYALSALGGHGGYFPKAIAISHVDWNGRALPVMFTSDFPCLELNVFQTNNQEDPLAININPATMDIDDLKEVGLQNATLSHPEIQTHIRKEIAKILATTYGLTGHLPGEFNLNAGDIVLRLYDHNRKPYNYAQLTAAVNRNALGEITQYAKSVIHLAMITFRGGGVKPHEFMKRTQIEPTLLSSEDWSHGAAGITLDSTAAEKLVIALQRIPPLCALPETIHANQGPYTTLYDANSGPLIRAAVREVAATL